MPLSLPMCGGEKNENWPPRQQPVRHIGPWYLVARPVVGEHRAVNPIGPELYRKNVANVLETVQKWQCDYT